MVLYAEGAVPDFVVGAFLRLVNLWLVLLTPLFVVVTIRCQHQSGVDLCA